jgi:phosphopantothenoylcysteine decarboxylase/phosphopantothenate--cysteine ligase
LVAPATATVLGRAACGLADDLPSAVILSTQAPVCFVPAMHKEMWMAPATQRNVEALRGMGMPVMEPSWGELAAFDEGPGRFPDTSEVLAFAELVLEWSARRSAKSPSGSGGTMGFETPEVGLRGVEVLVTAGGTREPIDPVRYISNRSSGKMGIALAREAWLRGATVVLVSTVDPGYSDPRFEVVRVETAEEMRDAVMSRVSGVDVVVMAAAVADFRPRKREVLKIKKDEGLDSVELEPTTDILSEICERKMTSRGRPAVVVGFAAETHDVERYGLAKLSKKGADLIVANDVSSPESGFEVDTNRATLIWREGEGARVEALPLMPKRALARRIWDRLQEGPLTSRGDS